jgi:uncharacterized protein YqjF (DUF2071 family)
VTGGLLFVAFFLLLVSMGFQRANGLPYYYVGMAVLSLGGAAVAAVTAVTGWRSRRSVRGVLGVVIGALAVPGDLLLGAYAAYAAFHYFVVYATPY